MPNLTLTEKHVKPQLSRGLVASYDIWPGIIVGLFWETRTHAYLLTYLPQPKWG